MAFLVGPGVCSADEPEPPKNLQYFPKDIEREVLIDAMRDFSFALGVACTHCHGTEEQTGYSLKGVDFALDLKPTKAKAREMLRMTEQINTKLLSQIPSSPLDLKVSCFTCHSGLSLPETIQARVLRTIEAKGLEAALEDYRATRERHYGDAAYDFGQQPLVEAAATLHEREQYEAAAALSRLNLEFHPRSGQSSFRLAEAYLALGQKESARALYTELLERRPGDRRARERLEELGPGEGEAKPEGGGADSPEQDSKPSS
jgi:tetratricopeptide (TPR) repeat protein